ncbi:hypothetical protein PR003_g26766 [Phytophthora rubi]|uniref:Uncharacterized protein n=1 Tax=Phytophthora rubi TaxID=129364 RepID=A0A6A4CCY2_9STRA|nr:hypothetical protein PR003_g26766 [Phytophthora rubi]
MESLCFAYAAAQERAELAIERAAQLKEAAWARFNAEQNQREATEARLQATLEDNRREQTKLREEHQRLQAANIQMSEAQRTAQSEQRKQLEALEKLVERRVAAESEKRKEDEARTQYLLGAQKKLQEAEIRAKQEELQRTHVESAAKARTEHDAELLRLREKHAQAQAIHEQAVAEREEKLRQLQADQEQFRNQASSRIQRSNLTSTPNPSRTSAEVSVISTVIDPVLAKLDRLTGVMHQMVQTNQRQAEATDSQDKTTKAQSSPRSSRTKSSTRTSTSASKRNSKTRTMRSKKTGDDDWGSDSSSSSDSSQDELEGQFGTAA